MKKVAWYLVFTATLLLMVVAIFIYLAPHFGWRVNAVLSGSMEPELEVGSLIVSRPVDPETVEVGDIIIFRPVSVGENLITHRVIGIGHRSSLYFETKGDANAKPDPFTVPAQNVVGKVTFNAPYWGYFTEFLKSPFGFMFAVVIPGIILLVMYSMSILRALAQTRKQRAI